MLSTCVYIVPSGMYVFSEMKQCKPMFYYQIVFGHMLWSARPFYPAQWHYSTISGSLVVLSHGDGVEMKV